MDVEQWPVSGQWVSVVAGGLEHAAVVDDVRPPHSVVLREPVSVSAAPLENARLLLVWNSPAGRHQLHVAMHGTSCDPMPLWELLPLGGPQLFQRRAFARAADAIPAQLARGGRRWPGVVADIGEGGARCVLNDADGLARGDQVQLHLVLEGQDLLLPAEVLTVEGGAQDKVTARLRFGPLGRVGDRLHRRVLDQQRRARALGQR